MTNKIKIMAATLLLLPGLLCAQIKNCQVKVVADSLQQNPVAYFTIGEHIDTAKLDKGVFVFNLQPGDARLGKLTVNYTTEMANQTSPPLFVYLEEGQINIHIRSLKSPVQTATVSGPQLTKDYQEKLLLPVTTANAEVALAGHNFRHAKRHNLDTIALKKTFDEAIRKCFEVPQVYIKANPRSPLSLVALGMLGDGQKGSPITVNDLENLYNSLDEVVKESPEGAAFADKLGYLKQQAEQTE